MKRNRQHIIEDESEILLRSLIPTEWVLRKLTPDYGIDYNVEIFDNNESTGFHFFLQLKGTDKESTNNEISFQLDKRYIEYFKSVTIPILFVYISVKSNVAWAKWSNNLAINTDNQSRLLKFTANDVLTKGKIRSIRDNFLSSSRKIRINYKTSDENANHNILEKWVRFYLRGCISTEASEIADEIVVNLKQFTSDNALVNIKDDRFLIDYDFSLRGDIEKLYVSIPEIDELPLTVQPFVFEISKLLIHRENDIALDVARKIIPKLTCHNFSDVIYVTGKCISKNKVKWIEELCLSAIKQGNWDVYQYIYISTLFEGESEEIHEIKGKSLLKAISASDELGLKGIFCYNLANHYHNKGVNRKALKYYNLAKKFEPEYINRGYWLREVAGTLFMLNKFLTSSLYYRKCLEYEEIKGDPINFALAGDACFMARKFTHSLKYFEAYCEAVECQDIEYTLKRQALKSIRDQFGFKDRYYPKKAVQKFNELKTKPNQLSFDQLSLCLSLDPLSPEIRYEEGQISRDNKEYEDSCISFLIAALVFEYSPEPWLNSFFMAFENKSHMMGIVLNLAFKKCGFGLIECLRTDLLKEMNMPIELQAKFIEAFRAQFESYMNEKDNKILNTDSPKVAG